LHKVPIWINRIGKYWKIAKKKYGKYIIREPIEKERFPPPRYLWAACGKMLDRVNSQVCSRNTTSCGGGTK
jgi:hypothetical protein